MNKSFCTTPGIYSSSIFYFLNAFVIPDGGGSGIMEPLWRKRGKKRKKGKRTEEEKN